MKKIILISSLFLSFICPLSAQTVAPTDREILLELVKQVAETNKQIAETNKQQAITNAEFKTKFEGIDKRFDEVGKRMDMLLYIMLGILAGIFGLIAMTFWDRRAAMRPIEEKAAAALKENEEFKKEIALIKEKELKLEKRILKSENQLKKIAEIEPRFAGN